MKYAQQIDLWLTGEALDSSELIVFDVGVFLDTTLSTHYENSVSPHHSDSFKYFAKEGRLMKAAFQHVLLLYIMKCSGCPCYCLRHIYEEC